MTTILLVRHGESAANRDKVFAGHYDAELLSRGFEQACLTARYIKETYQVDAVYSSDLQRAYNTGKCIAEMLQLPVETDKRLREINAGVWEGVPFQKIAEDYPEEYKTWVCDIGHVVCPKGENVVELGERVMTALREKAEKNDGKTILVASHATPVRVACAMVKFGSAEATGKLPWPSNASVSVLHFDNGTWSLGEYSIDEHMADLRTFFSEGV